MLTNVDQVESYFSNPENVHKLYVYEVVDFNNNIESIISENTNNFLKIKLIGVKRGIYESCSFSPQVKVMGANNDIGVKINTDLVFISNDDFSFLERTKKLYVFTINEEFINDQDIYIITDNSIKAMNELSDEDLDKIKLDDADNLINLYSIGLQNIKKLEVGKNSTINFKLVDDLPDFSSGENKISSITYTLPINSLVQAIQLIGTIKNSVINDNNFNIENEQINIDLADENIGFLPLYVRLKNTNPKAVFEILNLSIDKQLSLNLLKKIFTGEEKDFYGIFSDFKNKTTSQLDNKIKELVVLIKKMLLITWIYINDFNIFDKKNEDFVNYYNATYANKKAIDYNTNLISNYEMKYPEMINTIPYSIFKAICFNLSHMLYSPFGVEKDKLSDLNKEILWFWVETSIDVNMVKASFNNNGSFKDDSIPAFPLFVNSNYYAFSKIETDNGENIHVVYKFIKFNDIKKTNYLPITTITKIDDQWYQCWLFFRNKNDANNIMFDYYKTKKQKQIKTLSKQNVFQDGNGTFPTVKDVAKLLPPDVGDSYNVLGEPIKETFDGDPIPVACPLPTNNRTTRVNEYTTDGWCYYRTHYPDRPITTPHSLDNENARGYNESKQWVGIKYNKVYKLTVTFVYETEYNYTDSVKNWTSAELTNFLLLKNDYKYNYVDVPFVIDKSLSANGWNIINLKEDYCFGFMNSPTKTSINYFDKNNDQQSFTYNIKHSFQKIDNCNALTRNKY